MVDISGDGRFVVVASHAKNLVGTDTTRISDIVLFDRVADKAQLVSRGAGGDAANARSYEPAISADGRFVAFTSLADNLVVGDTNEEADVFVWDRFDRSTTRVSIASDGRQANSWSHDPALSTDGQFITFESNARNLIRDDTNDYSDIFVRNLARNKTALVSASSQGTQGAFAPAQEPAISGSGRFVVFASSAENLVSNDDNSLYDIFVRDRWTGGQEPHGSSPSAQAVSKVSGTLSTPTYRPMGGSLRSTQVPTSHQACTRT